MVHEDEKASFITNNSSNDRKRDSSKNQANSQPKFSPETTEQIGPMHVSSGSTIRLRCEAKGYPTPKINWLKV